MAIVKPFRGVRPPASLAQEVASRPYDVMDDEEARAMTSGKPRSFLRVTRSEVNLDQSVDHYSPQVYDMAHAVMRRFLDEGTLRQDEEPSFYIYRLKMGNHVQAGVVAACSIDEYEDNLIKKHELTRPDKELDRVNHILATGAQTGAVFLTYRRRGAVDLVVKHAMKKSPDVEFTSDDGISHSLWVVSSPQQVAALEEAFASVPALYIADGHHRVAAASRARDRRRQQSDDAHTGDEDYNRFLGVMFPHDETKILDYNRVVADLNGLTPAAFLEAVRKNFMIEELMVSGTDTGKPGVIHQFGMFVAGKWYRITPHPDTFDDQNRLNRLDVNVLQELLLGPVLAIGDPRIDKRIGFVGGIRGMAELESMVRQGKAAVAFALYPTSIDDLMAVSDAGEIMPPKSTWFEPKLRDAMVVHMI